MLFFVVKYPHKAENESPLRVHVVLLQRAVGWCETEGGGFRITFRELCAERILTNPKGATGCLRYKTTHFLMCVRLLPVRHMRPVKQQKGVEEQKKQIDVYEENLNKRGKDDEDS